MITRRGLLGGILASCIAPGFVRAGSLMVPAPKRIVTPRLELVDENGYARASQIYQPNKDVIFDSPGTWGTITAIFYHDDLGNTVKVWDGQFTVCTMDKLTVKMEHMALQISDSHR